MTEDVWGLKTRILHHGAETDPHTGAAAVPVYQVSTFAQKDPVNLGKYEYARGENPTREALEHAIAELEGGAVGVAFASGMAAISSVLLLFRPGDHLLIADANLQFSSRRKKEQIRRSHSVNGCHKCNGDPLSDLIDLVQMLHHLDQAEHGADDADGR